MRFMGFSKSNLPVRFAALALAGAFVASLLVVALPSEAEAGKRRVWSVKFKCTDDAGVIDLPLIGGNTQFTLETIINIHNPTDKDVDFNTKMAIHAPQHVAIASEVTDKVGETLNANEGFSFDCIDIVAELNADAGITTTLFDVENIIEGWVVIEANKESLAVCANYNKALFFEDDQAYFVAEDAASVVPVDTDPFTGTVTFGTQFTAGDGLAGAGGVGLSAAGGVSVSVVCYDPIKVRGKFVAE